jgi:hypothetical protein
MDKKLIIKKPGLFIDILGIPNFRTPAEVDISKFDENLVRAELRKHNIRDFEIIIGNIKSKKDNAIQNITYNYYGNTEELEEIIKKQQDTINNVEKLLKELLSSKVENNEVYKIEKLKKTDDLDDVEDFIPTIDISKIKGKFSR